MYERINIAYDLDDTMVAFDQPFRYWLKNCKQVELGPMASNDYLYDRRYPEAIDHDTGRKANFGKLLGEFTLEASVDLITVNPGVQEHLDKQASVIRPIVITSRPYAHVEPTRAIIKKHFSEWITDTNEVSLASQLYMPDKDFHHSQAPRLIRTKALLAASMNAKGIVDDLARNLEQPVVKVGDKYTTLLTSILFRNRDTVWNHHTVSPEIKVANNWLQVDEILGKYVVSDATKV